MNCLHAPPACRLALVGLSRLSLRQVPQSRRLATVVGGGVPAEEAKQQQAEEREKTRAERDAEEGRVHGHLPEHGQKIWVHNHTYDGHILYSFTKVMDTNKAYRQMPYTGKKNVPAKLRKDYWRPLALIDFGDGLNDVGRSVFQKLREFKKRHELEWGRDDPEVEKRLLHMSKHKRGKELNNQRPNAVADVAAVLGGVGKGSKMWMVDWEDLKDKKVTVESPAWSKTPIGSAQLAEADKTGEKNARRLEALRVPVMQAGERKFVDWQALSRLTVDVKDSKEESSFDLESFKKLHKTKIYWAREEYLRYAKDWTDNVEHIIGLPGGKRKPEAAVIKKGSEQWQLPVEQETNAAPSPSP
ncbi:transcriptional regulation of mitochondrial recombination-domain-containing protein [Cercophora newfieldiana]|uniref:Large ribosomal subunit protein mL67 n=1 Tax=Cercophora newfieldiana TaxID=92897 RepID=A0AA39Y4I4_9PEZI|nr:transcriptional regulation of mitochondrial recombination-domain-containing protein [Cercophora newfieldiana]